jgi:putative holliday junction resolvase
MTENKKPIQGRRFVGIDYGLARLGLALSDERKIIASPLMVLTAEKKTEETAKKLVQVLKQHAEANHYIIEKIVIGLPLMMSGKKGMIADEVVHFVELMHQHIDVPIETWDERLTSVQADRSMREGNLTRKKRARSADIVAACIILQNYLDRHSMG